MRYILSRKRVLALVALGLALVLGPATTPRHTQAQSGGALSYGSAVAGTLTAEAPLILYSFQGHTGDLVEIEVMGLSGGLFPLVDLIAPDRQPLVSAQRDGLSFAAQDAHIALVLPQDGTYAMMLGGAEGSVGDFLLTLEGRAPLDPPAPVLAYGEPESVTLSPEDPFRFYTFTAESCPTTLTLVNASAGEPFTFPFFAEVRNEQGEEVARWRGGETYENRVTVEPLSGTYEVLVWSDEPLLEGTLTLAVTCADQAPACLADATGAVGTAATRCPTCPPCGSTEGGERCAGFHLTATDNGDGTATITWTAVEGANAAIVSSTDESGALVYARMVEGTTSDTINYAELGITGGVQTVRVTVGSEELGYELCGDSVSFELNVGPVDWGEGADDLPEECSITLESPRDVIADGLQTFFWSDVAGAEGYELHISNSSDSLILVAGMAASSHSVTINTSEAVIGPGTEFYIRIFALRDDIYWCMDGVIAERH